MTPERELTAPVDLCLPDGRTDSPSPSIMLSLVPCELDRD